MLEEVIDHQSEQLPLIEEISTPVLNDDQIFELCDPEFIQDTLLNSEVTSCSNFCQKENITSCNNLSLSEDPNNIIYTATTTTATSTTVTAIATNNNIVISSQDEIDNNDISASIDFSSSPDLDPNPPFFMPPIFTTQQQENMNLMMSSSPMQPRIPLTTSAYSDSPDPVIAPPMLSGPTFPPHVFDEDCLSNAVPPTTSSYMPLNPSIVGQPTAYVPGNLNGALVGPDGSSIFMASILMNNDMQAQDPLDQYQADKSGIYCSDSMSCLYYPHDTLQAFCGESQNLVTGHVTTTALAAEISSLEESSYKVGKLSVEQRKEKIHRYMKKRNERNFSKKIKYACRKTLADSRPRVRGRFAKNDDFGDALRSAVCSSSSHHEEDDKDDVDVKEEDDILDTSDIFSHISGVNSFKCSFPMIQSWI